MSVETTIPQATKGLVLGVMLTVRFPLLILGQSLFALGVGWDAAGSYWPVYLSLIVDLPCLLMLRAVLRAEGKGLRSLLGATDQWRRDVVRGMVLYVPLSLAIILGRVAATLIVYGDPSSMPSLPVFPLWVALWAVLVFPITTAVTEELMFRGYALPRLEAKTGSKVVAVALMTAGFALHHTVIPVLGWTFGLAFFVALILPSVFQGWIYFRHLRLLPLLIAHHLADLASGVMLGFFPELLP
ncbi:MAG: CPBP family intramembrane metalloprotease [Verrucomicrobia bacterium]|nr:CPBP family intramembrane metalloprotease [Verrucomicrobiota bacterium]